MKVYVVESGNTYEGGSIEGSSIEGVAMSLETATKIVEKAATDQYGYNSFTKIDKMHWTNGCDYISISKWEVEE